MDSELLTLSNIDELCALSHLYRSYPNPTGPQRTTIRQACRNLSDEASVLMDYLTSEDKDIFSIDVDAYTKPESTELLSGKIVRSDSYVTSTLNYVSDAYLNGLSAVTIHKTIPAVHKIPLHYVREAITNPKSPSTIDNYPENGPKLSPKIELAEDPNIVSCRNSVVSDSENGRFYNVSVSNAEHAAWFAVRSCGWCRLSNIFDLVAKASVYSDLAKRDAGVGAPFKMRLAKDVREQARIRCLRRLAFYTQLRVGPSLDSVQP